MEAARVRGGERLPGRPAMLLVVCVALVAAALRLTTRSLTPLLWDPVNFALAIDGIDLSQHRPHPPPAIGYVIAGRALRLWLGDANLALVSWNLLMTALAVVVVFLFAARAAPRDPERHGWLAVAVLLGSPLLWFYGCVAEIYASEMLLALMAAYACLRLLQGGRLAGEGLALSLALLGAFRVSGLLFMMPLALFVLWRTRPPRLWRSVALFTALTAAWAVPFLAAEGIVSSLALSWSHFAQTATPTSVISGAPLRELNRHLRDALTATASGVGPFGLLAWPLFVSLRRPRLVPGSLLLALAALWVGPGTLFYILVHMAKPGYLLPLVPALSLAAAFHYAQEPRRAVRWALGLGHVAFGGLFFLWAQPWSGPEIGEGRRYADKSLAQKARTELNAIHFATWETIRSTDRQLLSFGQAWRSACSGASEAVIVGQDGPGLNWRRLMYAFPEASVVRVPTATSPSAMVGRAGRFEIAASLLQLKTSCPTFWVLPGRSPVVGKLREQTSVETVSASGTEWHVTRGPVSVPLSETSRLRLR